MKEIGNRKGRRNEKEKERGNEEKLSEKERGK
jgi:hypothetical protein